MRPRNVRCCDEVREQHSPRINDAKTKFTRFNLRASRPLRRSRVITESTESIKSSQNNPNSPLIIAGGTTATRQTSPRYKRRWWMILPPTNKVLRNPSKARTAYFVAHSSRRLCSSGFIEAIRDVKIRNIFRIFLIRKSHKSQRRKKQKNWYNARVSTQFYYTSNPVALTACQAHV